jgi:hypothetical protein
MEKFYKTPEFYDQMQEWYKKLEDEGFEDIEVFKNNKGQFRSTPYINGDIKNLYKSRQEMSDEFFREHCNLTYLYYAACRAFLAYNRTALPFLDAKILELHSEGYSLRRIVKHLRGFVCRYPKINRRIKDISFFGMFYVRERVNKLKHDVTLWNLTNENGVRLEDYEDPITTHLTTNYLSYGD